MHCADSRSARLTAASTPECEDHFTQREQRKPMHALYEWKAPACKSMLKNPVQIMPPVHDFTCPK